MPAPSTLVEWEDDQTLVGVSRKAAEPRKHVALRSKDDVQAVRGHEVRILARFARFGDAKTGISGAAPDRMGISWAGFGPQTPVPAHPDYACKLTNYQSSNSLNAFSLARHVPRTTLIS